MSTYLVMMAIRLVELERVLKPGGTLYLHCDPTASHYLKLILDAVFGPRNFRNEIIWGYSGGGIPKNDFPRKHDIIFRYSKGKPKTYNPLYKPYTRGTVERGRTRVKGIHAQLRKEGTPIPDWWFSNLECSHCGKKLPENIKRLASPTDPEKLSYPTQKSEDLLERIILASSNEGDVVLDPFCGCGTTIVVAERLKRRWIGIDITHLAVSLMKSRLQNTFGEELSPFEVHGIPTDLPSAEALARDDKTEFENWAVGLIDNAIPYKLRGPDGGIDGFINFFDDDSGKAKRIIIQVKSGKVSRNMIATLKGDMERENAVIGAFITLRPSTRPMKEEAASAGFYVPRYFPSYKYPRIQILTIEELLNGVKLKYPRMGVETFKKAQRKSKEGKSKEQELGI